MQGIGDILDKFCMVCMSVDMLLYLYKHIFPIVLSIIFVILYEECIYYNLAELVLDIEYEGKVYSVDTLDMSLLDTMGMIDMLDN